MVSLVGAPLEPVGMFIDESSAALAAAGMNALVAEPRRPDERLARTEYRAPHDWPTQYLPQINTSRLTST